MQLPADLKSIQDWGGELILHRTRNLSPYREQEPELEELALAVSLLA
jgi:hypothetical protein